LGRAQLSLVNDSDRNTEWEWLLDPKGANDGDDLALSYRVMFSDKQHRTTEDDVADVSVPIRATFDWIADFPIFVSTVGGLFGWATSVQALREKPKEPEEGIEQNARALGGRRHRGRRASVAWVQLDEPQDEPQTVGDGKHTAPHVGGQDRK